MSWSRFLRRKRSDAELQDEIESFLTQETADNEARGMSARRGPAAGADKVRQCAESARIAVGAELSASVDEYRPRFQICLSYVEPHPRLFHHRGCGDGSVHRRSHISFHNCALGFAEAASFPGSRPAGDGVRAPSRGRGEHDGFRTTIRSHRRTFTIGARRPRALKTWQSWVTPGTT